MIAESLPWLVGLGLLAGLWAAPRFGLRALWARLSQKRMRRRFEDALKHMLAWERRGKIATPESISGALSWSPRKVLALVTRMESQGLLTSGSEGLTLTPDGERLALQVVRAHRLLERYLADEAGLPMSRLHQAAERGEHDLSPEGADRLDAHLGHPQRDPHGDPIPTREGDLPLLEATTLTEWPEGRPARIVHIEDEPAVIFDQILAAGLRPGMTVWIVEKRPERLIVSVDDAEHRLALAVAANIQVADATPNILRDSAAVRLSALPFGVRAEVLDLDEECRGFSRRRLMDLGMTPGAIIQPALENTFGDPRAYRLRGATIALRKQQAGQVWVRPLTRGREAAA